ncbi:ANTAR domain-containing protein [Arthrobacter sp. NPDC056493]|uniref:ANTAR domain-containing protein n=1 Tax=Arthrobacter sp. NPDC056493 TaxID=3345839 RepID=UPI003671F8BA
MAAQALRLAVRIASADLLAEDLKAAMESRTAIDLATGIIMEQDHCSQYEAFAMLRDASQNRNEKLRSVAEGILEDRTANHEPTSVTHFEE